MMRSEDYELRERQQYAAALKSLREEAGMTQQEAADAADITLPAWQNYEYAKRRFSRKMIERASRAVQATPEGLELRRTQLFPAANPRMADAAEMAEGEREFSRGFLSPEIRFRLVHSGERLTRAELDRLISMLQIQRDALGDG